MTILLIAFGFRVQYRALRCAARAGLKVIVLGTPEASLFKLSQYCQEFIPICALFAKDSSHCKSVEAETELAALQEQIEEISRSRKLDLLISGDARATRLLVTLKHRLSVPVFPAPSLEAFECLDDKWNFYQLCRRLNVLTPRTWLFAGKEELREAIGEGKLTGTFIAKPPRLSGLVGIVKFDTATPDSQLDRIDYAPVLVQDFIEGQDIDLSLFAAGGRVVATLAYYRQAHSFFFVTNAAYLRQARLLVSDLAADGILNFDARLDKNGNVYMLECNPRVYYSMDYSMIAGINFIEVGLRNRKDSDDSIQVIPDVKIKTTRALLKSLITPWRINGADLRMFWHNMSEPLPNIVELSRLAIRHRRPRVRQVVQRFRSLQPLLE